ncbi:MAG: hypothetical protein JJT78_04135, partial [Leptospira sp.]|nr:hypothetical protein [Leptospira sp.]
PSPFEVLEEGLGQLPCHCGCIFASLKQFRANANVLNFLSSGTEAFGKFKTQLPTTAIELVRYVSLQNPLVDTISF